MTILLKNGNVIDYASRRNEKMDVLIKDNKIEKVEKQMKTLYLDYKQELLDEEDYKKYYKEKSNEKNRIKNELAILEKEESYKNIITEDKVNELVERVLSMKVLNREIISEIVSDIKIDKDNQIYIYYKYDVFNMVV